MAHVLPRPRGRWDRREGAAVQEAEQARLAAFYERQERERQEREAVEWEARRKAAGVR
jgi:hypothetical protein